MFLSMMVVALPVLAGTHAQVGDDKDQPATIDLGGPRRARVTVAVTDEEYLVKVRMLPVQCFDETANASLNREKARSLGLQALGRHLWGKETTCFTVSGVRVNGSGKDGNYFALTLRVPREGIVMVKETAAQGDTPQAKTTAKTVTVSSTLLTAKQDWQETVDHVASSIGRDIEEALKTVGEKDGQSFSLVVAEVEDRALKNINTLAQAITVDRLLLTVERDELLDLLEKQNTRALQRLKKAVQQHESKEGSPKP